MAVTREQAEHAMRVLAAEFAANADRIAAVMGVESVTFEFGGTITEVTHPFWVAVVRRGVAVHQAGTGGFTVDPCRRSMRTGERLTRAEVDTIDGHTWCSRCGGEPT